MSFFAGLVATRSSLTAVSSPSSCTTLQYIRCATFLAGFAMDTVLDLNGLLVFLVSSVAVTIFACSLLTVASCLTLITSALTIYRMHKAHSAFVALGPGLALPDSCAGFWQAIQIARHGPVANGAGFLQPISLRQGPTPYTVGTTLHEQINQEPLEDVQQYFADRLALFASMHSEDSITTSPTLATAACSTANACDCISSLNVRTFGCSVCCPRRNNCGAHVILHPADFEEVVRTGHGEIHPLAQSSSSFSRSRGNSCLSGTLALVYAPREYSEVCTVMRIIEAGAKYLASIKGKGVDAV
jgi:hypothetical protein